MADPAAYLRHAVREPPGRDVEFGYPDLRPENAAAAAFWDAHAPFALHMSLHGMAVCDGALLLIGRDWAGRTGALRDAYAAELRASGFALHDHDRKGEKGFHYLGPGFQTAPEADAMRAHFRDRGDAVTAGRFRASSMDYVRGLGGGPLCLVTELPLFLLPAGVDVQAFRERAPELRLRLERGEPLDLDARPVDVAAVIRLQLTALRLGLELSRPSA